MERLTSQGIFGNGKLIDIDGVRVEFPDGWGLVRASNTTPMLTLRFEADNKINYSLHNPQEWGMCGNGMLYLENSSWEKKGNSLVIHAKGGYFIESVFEYVIEYDIAQITDTELRLVNKNIIQSSTGPSTY